MKTEKLNKKYTSGELAKSFVFRNKLTTKQKQEANKQLAETRKKTKPLSESQTLYARVLQLRFQIENYTKSSHYNEELSLASFLKQYIKLSYKINKHFARDIDIDVTELSQILNKHRAPSEKTMVRLEIHSNNIISAVDWYRLLEKEKEHELQTNVGMRKIESKHVKKRLPLNL